MTGSDAGLAPDSAERPGRPKTRWKLWHLMGLVLAFSLLFGFAHAMGGVHFLIALIVAGLVPAAMLTTGIGSIAYGLKLGERVADALGTWGRRRGGWMEPVVDAVGLLAWFLIGFLAILLGLVAGLILSVVLILPILLLGGLSD